MLAKRILDTLKKAAPVAVPATGAVAFTGLAAQFVSTNATEDQGSEHATTLGKDGTIDPVEHMV